MRWDDRYDDWEQIRVGVSSADYSRAVTHYASTAWVHATGAGNVLPFLDVTTLPGWQPGMVELTPGMPIEWDVGISRGDRTGDLDMCGGAGPPTW